MPSRGHYAVVISCWLSGTSTPRRRDYSIWTNGTELASRNHLLAARVNGIRIAFNCPHHPSVVNHLKTDRFVRGQIQLWVPCLSCYIGEDVWSLQQGRRTSPKAASDIMHILHSITEEPLLSQDESTAMMAVMGYTHPRK